MALPFNPFMMEIHPAASGEFTYFMTNMKKLSFFLKKKKEIRQFLRKSLKFRSWEAAGCKFISQKERLRLGGGRVSLNNYDIGSLSQEPRQSDASSLRALWKDGKERREKKER